MNLPKIIDNDRRNLFETIQEIAPEFDELSIATGYWDLPGTELILEKISKYKKIRLLIGREPLIPRHKQDSPEPDFPDHDIIHDLQHLPPTEPLRNTIIKIKELISEGKLEVRVYRKSFFHAKSYIFGNYKSNNGVGIIGSSNFTKNGLTKNTELNALESDHRIVFFQPKTETQEFGHLSWFDTFWNDESTENWGGEFVEILSESPVGDELFSPYQTYIKTLYELYTEELEDVPLKDTGSNGVELFEFQTKNVHALLRRLKKYKVAMLADSVGLGKTFTAIEIIKQYTHGENGKRRVEVICPKALSTQWEQEALRQGEKIYPVTLQNKNQIKKHKKFDEIAHVNLFVIDESHNLKNRAGKRFAQIVEWIENNPRAHVLLLTATPINNQLSDITNQILLGSRGRADILKVTINKNKQVEIIDFNKAIENLKKKINQDLTRTGDIDYEYIKKTMSPILRAFIVRQTRQGIEREYGGLIIDGVNKVFPKVEPHINKYSFSSESSREIQNLSSKIIDIQKIYSLDTKQIVKNTKDLLHPLDQIQKLEIESPPDIENSPIFFVYQTILMLGFLPYRWQLYQTKFYGKTRSQIKGLNLTINANEKKSLFLQLSIYGILRTMYLKRMESSVSSFRKSIENYKRKLNIFEQGIEAGKIISVKNLQNIEEHLEMESEEFDIEEIDTLEEDTVDIIMGNKYNLKALKADIAKEKELIAILEQQMKILEEDDTKLKSFAKLMDSIAEKKTNGGKILVFSFYSDTVKYLEENLFSHTKHFNKENTEFLTSKNRNKADSLLERFSPKSKGHSISEEEKELSCLVSTDVLSEGQNLQDCGILINFDLHWNPTRMIQRNGRVNRLGTEYPKVYIYNLSPEAKIEEHLKLISSLRGKIDLIKNTIGTDTPVLDEKENPIEFSDSWAEIYSDDMQKRILALESAEQESDLLLSEDVYISDLKNFDKNADPIEKKRVYGIPLGKWSLMPSDTHSNTNERPEVLVLNTLRAVEKDEETREDIVNDIGHTFLSMSRDPKSPVRYVSNLEALEWLKTNEDYKKTMDNISCDKSAFSKNANEKAENTEVVAGSAIGQERDLIDILMRNHVPRDDIILIRDSFQTRNVLDEAKIRKLKRQIVKSHRDGRLNLSLIKELLKIAQKTKDNNFTEQSEVDHNVQQLFYVTKNN